MTNFYNLYARSAEGKAALKHLADDDYSSDAITLTKVKRVRILGDQWVTIENTATYDSENNTFDITLMMKDANGATIMDKDHSEAMGIGEGG